MPMMTLHDVRGMTHKQIAESLEKISNIRVMSITTVHGTATVYYITVEEEVEEPRGFEDDNPSEFWDLYD